MRWLVRAAWRQVPEPARRKFEEYPALGLAVVVLLALLAFASEVMALRSIASNVDLVLGSLAALFGMLWLVGLVRGATGTGGGDLHSYRDALLRVMEHSSRPFQEQFEITHVIGSDGSGDSTSEMHVTSPASDGSILWRHRWIHSGQSPGVPERTFQELRVRLEPKAQGDPPTGRVVELEQRDGMNALILFHSAIEPGNSLGWRLEYSWKGYWDRLRERCRDDWCYSVTQMQEFSAVTIRFKFPRNAIQPGVIQPAWQRGRCTIDGPVKTTDGAYLFTCVMAEPAAGEYKWYLNVDRFD